MSHPKFDRQVVASESCVIRMGMENLDLDALRRAFGTLCDRVAERLFVAGLDFDEVEVERSVLLNVGGREIEADAEFLSEVALLRRSIERQLRERGVAHDGAMIVVGIRAEAWAELH